MRTAEKRRKLLRVFLIIVFCVMTGYGLMRLIPYIADLTASRETSRELQQIYYQTVPEADPSEIIPGETVFSSSVPAAVTETLRPADPALPDSDYEVIILPTVEYSDNPGLTISERFRRLRKTGKYIIGWISFDEVDEPVVQKDNSYFLKRDATGKKNSNGAIFLDSGISLQTRPYTIILYGHNMKSGNMFGRLKKYKESAYFYKHRIITFDTMYEDGQYAVFAVMEFEAIPGVTRWYDLWSLTKDFKADREKSIRELERRSVINSALDVQADDQILLLVTCLDGDTERLAVAARRLREGETPESLKMRQDQ